MSQGLNQLIDGLWAEGVAHLGTVKCNSNYAQLVVSVVGDVGQLLKARHLVPDGRVKELGNLLGHASRLTLVPVTAEVAQAIRASARVVSIPMRTRFRGVESREALLFEGPNGWAEWSPFLEYSDDEAVVWLAAAAEFAFDAMPPALRTRIGVNATLPAVSPNLVADTLAPFGEFRTVKIKVAEKGQNLNDDLQRIFQVRKLYPEARIRLDANGGFTVDLAATLGAALFENGIPLDYFEQPVATVAELADVKVRLNRLGIKVAADESVRKASDPLAVARAGAADLLVVKVAPLGGVTRALQIVAEAGLPAVVSSALDTSIGISMGLHLAASLPSLEFDCGLGTVALLTDDICDQPLIPANGYLDVTRVVPSAQKLAHLEASPERTAWWFERLERCLTLA
jgi:o-succinylbenzoate synthase